MLLVPSELRPSPIHGMGVFALEPIRKGRRVWQFDPGIDQRHPVAWLEQQPEHVRRFVLTYGVLSLDRQYYGLVGDQTLFVNHSLSPNLLYVEEVRVNGDGVVVAARDVKPGEELTINYATIDGKDQELLSRGLDLFETSPVA